MRYIRREHIETDLTLFHVGGGQLRADVKLTEVISWPSSAEHPALTMRSTYSSGSGATGSGSVRNPAEVARDTTGKGWESVGLFHSYSEAPRSLLQATQQQHEEQSNRLIFPDVSPSAPTAASPVYTRARSGSTPPSSSTAATRGISSSRASPWIFFQPSTAVGPLQEQPYREAHQRPSPWQGRSPLAPVIVTASPVFPGNRTSLSQPGTGVAVPISGDRYLDGPHALYRAARFPAPAVQASRLQHITQIPQQTVAQTPPQFSGKISPPLQPQFPSKAPSLGSATEGTCAERDTPRVRSRLTPLAAGVADSAAPRAVFPDSSFVDAATPANNQSSIGTAVSSADVMEGETGQQGTRVDARVKQELSKKSTTSGQVDDTDLRVITAKQDTPSGIQAGTRLSSETLHTSRSQRDKHSAQGGACQAAVQHPPAFRVTAAEEQLGDNNTTGGIRQRSVHGAQKQQARTQQHCTQERHAKELDQDAVGKVPEVTRPTQPAETKGRKLSLQARRARLSHEILQVLQLDASDLIPPDNLPYFGPFDLIPSDLSQDVGISRGLIVDEPDSIAFKRRIGVNNAYVEQSRLSSTENRRSTLGHGYVDASGIRWIYKKLYAQAGRHLEQLRFRRLYSPTMAGTSAIYCLTFVLYSLLTVTQSFVRYLRFAWASTSSSMSEARPLLPPHSFAVGVLSLGASVCVLLAAVFSFRLFQRHLRISNLYCKISSSNSDASAPEAAPQGKPLSPQHTGFSSIYTEDVSTATQRIQVSLGAEYERLYTMCTRGDIVAGHKHAVEAADAALKSLLDSFKHGTAGHELSRQSDREEEKGNKTETLRQAQCDPCNTPVAEMQEKVESSPALTENLSPSTMTSKHASPHFPSCTATGSSEQRSKKNYAAFIQNIMDKNLIAYTTRLKGVETCAGVEDEAGLVTAIDVGLRNHTLHTMWLTFGCAVTAAVARMVLTLLLSQAVTPGVPSHWTRQQQTGDATAPSWNKPGSAGEELFFPARTPPPPSNWWERFKAEYHYGGNSLASLPRIHSVDAGGRTFPQFATTAVASTATSVLTELWIALNRLASFQMQAAGFMFFTQFVAVALLLQPREELRLTPVIARTTAFVQLGVAVVELLCTGFDALTLLLGELALKELVLLLVHLAGQRIVQLSRENFAAKITYRSRLPATFFTAAAAGALLASTCSARGAAAVEVFLAERGKRLRWGKSSILCQPSKNVPKSSSSPG